MVMYYPGKVFKSIKGKYWIIWVHCWLVCEISLLPNNTGQTLFANTSIMTQTGSKPVPHCHNFMHLKDIHKWHVDMKYQPVTATSFSVNSIVCASSKLLF